MKRGMIITLLPATILFSACTSTRPLFTATMEADPSELGPEGIALLNTLSLAYTKQPPLQKTAAGDDIPSTQLCRHTLPSYQERGKYSYRRHDKRVAGDQAAQQFECLYLVSNPVQGDVDRHIRAGIALSDLYCDTYFRRISRRWNERMFARNTTNDVGTAVSAALGLFNAGSVATGAAGAAFGLADATFRNYDNVFVVSPDLPNIQNLVRAEQTKVRERITTSMPGNYYDAQRMIIEYANLCSYTGMKGLLNESVDMAVNQRRPDAILGSIADAQTTKERNERLVAERRAQEREAQAAAVARENKAKKEIEAAKGEEDDAEPDGAEPGQPRPAEDDGDRDEAMAN